MQALTSATMLLLLLLLTDVAQVGPRLTAAASAAVAGTRLAKWGRNGGEQRANRGFRFGGADRFSHGFGRRRRVDDVKVAEPLL